MTKLLEELLGSSRSSNEQTGFIFFTEDGSEGYTNRPDFLTNLRNQKKDKPYRVDHIKTLFDSMALNRKLIAEPTLSHDDGEEIIWVRFGYGNLRQNLQILNVCNMYEFVKDYATGKAKNILNFEELIKSLSQE